MSAYGRARAQRALQPWTLTKCVDTQQMEGDPLKENLDQLLPLTDSGVRVVPASLPSAVEDICSALMEEEGVDAVDIGRQVRPTIHLSPNTELSAVEDICSALMEEEEGVDAVGIGRQACRAMHRSHHTQLFPPPGCR